MCQLYLNLHVPYPKNVEQELYTDINIIHTLLYVQCLYYVLYLCEINISNSENHIAIEHPPHIVLCDKINKICSSLYILQIQSSR